MRGYGLVKGQPPRNRPQGLSQDIIDTPIFEFRIDGKFRVMGYMSEAIFYICWFDPDHEMTDKN